MRSAKTIACAARLFLLCVIWPVQLVAQEAPAKLPFPPEGRWSLALGWPDNWPDNWRHVSAYDEQQVGDWWIARGRLELPQGVWQLQDSVRALPNGLWEAVRRWHWLGEQTLDKVTLSIRLSVPCEAARPFMPSINYYDNRAGQSVDPSRIPFIGDQPGDRGFYEEHRFSMPLVAVEACQSQRRFTSALHALPSPLRYGNVEDQWWSLGLQYTTDGVELALLSGAVASNGRNGVIKAEQKEFAAYPDAFCKIPPNAIIEKRFWYQQADISRRGDGFRPAVRQSAELFQPFAEYDFPNLQDVIKRKFVDLLQRWHEDEQCAGIDAFPDTNVPRAWFDLGWAGQSEAAAYPLILLGESFEVEQALEKAQTATDFICRSSPFDERGFRIRYDYHTHQWLPRSNPLSQAQAMHNLFNAVRAGREHPRIRTEAWEVFLQRAAEFHAARVLGDDWQPKSTNEGFLIKPLAQAADIFDQPRFLTAAVKAAEHYAERHLEMDEVYWGGTLDARCEDKEGAWAALQGFLAMYEATHEQHYLDWAAHAADVVLSYVYVWDVDLPPGRLTDHALKTRGWTSVSVQNMHLDVYGVLCAPALWKLGEFKQDRWYQQMARLMLVSCGQLVDARGGQGEQLHQTNYVQHYEFDRLTGVRGDYVESWNVFWITAHFLTAVAQLEELGVDWKSW